MTVADFGDSADPNPWAATTIHLLDMIERAVFAPGREPYLRVLGVLVFALIGLGLFLGLR